MKREQKLEDYYLLG